MGRYNANEAKTMEYQGADVFRLQPGVRSKVVFLYTDESSIDGWACHRLENASHYTFTVDCARGPKDPLEKCPACADGAPVYTRVFVRLLEVETGKILIWDKPASFRKELAAKMRYFNPLYTSKASVSCLFYNSDCSFTFSSHHTNGLMCSCVLCIGRRF